MNRAETAKLLNGRPVVLADSWTIVTANEGLQIMKNGRNVLFVASFEKAWSFVSNHGTPGDNVEIRVNGTLSVS